MKCTTVRTKLAGYLDDAITGAARVEERVEIREHLEGCQSLPRGAGAFPQAVCPVVAHAEDLPPADLAVRIKVAAAQAQQLRDWPSRPAPGERPRGNFARQRVPSTDAAATGGFFSAILVFVLVFQMIVPGITVRAVENDVPII